jgi:hypothetical protein
MFTAPRLGCRHCVSKRFGCATYCDPKLLTSSLLLLLLLQANRSRWPHLLFKGIPAVHEADHEARVCKPIRGKKGSGGRYQCEFV